MLGVEVREIRANAIEVGDDIYKLGRMHNYEVIDTKVTEIRVNRGATTFDDWMPSTHLRFVCERGVVFDSNPGDFIGVWLDSNDRR